MMFQQEAGQNLDKKIKKEVPEDQRLKLTEVDKKINKQFISDIDLKLK